MFNKKQIENFSKFFWELAKVMVASGSVAGIMMQNVPLFKVIIAMVLSGGFAILATIIDSVDTDDDEPP